MDDVVRENTAGTHDRCGMGNHSGRENGHLLFLAASPSDQKFPHESSHAGAYRPRASTAPTPLCGVQPLHEAGARPWHKGNLLAVREKTGS